MCVDDKFSKTVLEAILKEYDYCKKIITNHFNKNLVMSAEDEERFQLSNNCWICNKLFDAGDNKARDHCHITEKYRGSAHWSCNINIQLTKEALIIFYSFRGYESHLIMQEIGKFDVEVSFIPNGLENYMASTINKNSVFIDSMQFMNCNLDLLVKNLSDNHFSAELVLISEEFRAEFLKLVKQEGVHQ